MPPSPPPSQQPASSAAAPPTLVGQLQLKGGVPPPQRCVQISHTLPAGAAVGGRRGEAPQARLFERRSGGRMHTQASASAPNCPHWPSFPSPTGIPCCVACPPHQRGELVARQADPLLARHHLALLRGIGRGQAGAAELVEQQRRGHMCRGVPCTARKHTMLTRKPCPRLACARLCKPAAALKRTAGRQLPSPFHSTLEFPQTSAP